MKNMVFVEHPLFTRVITELVGDDEYAEFQRAMAENPEAGDVIPGLGGLRKVRLAIPGRGKRGGGRVLYLLFLRAETIFFVYAFTKGDMADLSPDHKRSIRKIVDEIKKEFSK